MANKTLVLVFMLLSFPVSAKDWPAHLDWSRRVSLSVPVSGIVTQVNAKLGDRVKAGEILLQLEQEGFKARVDSAQADLVQARHNLKEANREWQRAKELYERTVLSDVSLQKAKTVLVKARSRYNVRQATLKKEKLNLKYSTLQAPFEGMVVRREVELGQTIVSRLQANPLMILVEWGSMLAKFTVAEESLNDFKEGAKATVIINNRRFNGSVVSIGLEPVRKNETSRYEVQVRFSTQGQLLRAGQKGLVKIDE